MTTLLVCLAGPMQAWGSSSRFVQRATRQEPTKSGVLGLLAAAQGRRRTDPMEDLAALRFGVRVDQPGRLMRDFQVALSLDKSRVMPLSYRYYLSDATFVAGVEGECELISGLAEALANPTFPLYLGRRSCPPSRPVYLEVSDGSLIDALDGARWQAPIWYQRKQSSQVYLRRIMDAEHGEVHADSVRDVPVSFNSEHRIYGWRDVREDYVTVTNSNALNPDDGHDVMAAVGGA